ncbi:uncharacterized protein LOC141614595 [Silene latifolia]|uniref:uncharacterized protein LOC141614595 n=1 Tax=Silene latifolia TaxID=37657 RepID=UPI003D773525
MVFLLMGLCIGAHEVYDHSFDWQEFMAADWSTLPLDLLGDIAMKLETLEDFIYFSAIFNPNNNKCYKLNLPETFGTRCWGSDYGWVAMVDRDLNVRLFNPITKAEIRFPSVETIPDRPPYVEKRDGSEEHFFAKHGNQSWTSVFVRQELCVKMRDVVAMDGYVFALYNDATLVYWNIEDFQGHELVKPMDYSLSKFEMFEEFTSEKEMFEQFITIIGIGAQYLVQSGSDLLMVLRFKEEVLNSGGKSYDVD